MTPERFVRYLAERRASVSDNTVFNNLRMLAMMLKILAPGTDWGWMCRHALAPRRHEAVASRHPIPLARPDELLAGIDAASDVVLSEPVTKDSAIRLRDLLLVAVTTVTVLRRRNVLALTLDESCLRLEHGYEIRFPPAVVKNSRAISIMLRPELTAYLDRYIEVYRPALLAGDDHTGRALWISNSGKRLAAAAYETAFRGVTQAILGRKVHPHAMRHIAATTMLTRAPLATTTVSALLAHNDPTTLDRFYDLSGDEASKALWRKMLKKYRKGRGPRDA